MNTASQEAAKTSTPVQPFVEVVEVWTPDAASGALTLESGVFGGHAEFEQKARQTSFAKGEGLPGKAWADGKPVVLNGFHGTYFLRAEEAARSGLTTAVAIPAFNGAALTGVLVLFCSDNEERIGAVEVWREDTAQSGVLSLEDGYYGAAKHFEWVSRRTQFPRGQGLPGAVWSSGAAILLRDLGGSYRFVRAESAGAAGITTGLGLPVEGPDKSLSVVTLLSARGTPIARRFELWDAIGGGSSAGEFKLADGICAIEGPLWETERKVAPWQGPIGKVAGSGAPFAHEADGATSLPPGYASVVATPIHRKGRLAQIAAWYF